MWIVLHFVIVLINSGLSYLILHEQSSFFFFFKWVVKLESKFTGIFHRNQWKTKWIPYRVWSNVSQTSRIVSSAVLKGLIFEGDIIDLTKERAWTFLLCYQMNTEVLSWWSKENFRIETNIEKNVVKNFLISVSWQNTSVGSAWIRDMPEIISPTCAIAGKQG